MDIVPQKLICCVFNVGPHYRYPIYKEMEESFHPDFYIGNKAGTTLKTFDYSKLTNFKGTLKRINLIGNWYWMKGAIRLAFKPYNCFIITGEPFCISTWALLVLSRLQGKQTIAWTHGWYGRETGVKKIIKKLFFRLFSKIMCYNEYSANLMIEQGFDSKKVFVIANSLDTEKQLIVRRNLRNTSIFRTHFGNDFPVILYCGRIQKVKKLDQLILLMKYLRDKDIAANMVLVGKDVDHVGLEKMVMDSNLVQNVWLYGPCYEEEKLGELFYNSAVCISPGNVGLTGIHALTYGCPVITNDDFPNQMPEFEAIVPGVTGDFYRNGDFNDLVEKTIKWLGLSSDQREIVRNDSYAEIDRKWNVYHQIDVLKNVLQLQ